MYISSKGRCKLTARVRRVSPIRIGHVYIEKRREASDKIYTISVEKNKSNT